MVFGYSLNHNPKGGLSDLIKEFDFHLQAVDFAESLFDGYIHRNNKVEYFEVYDTLGEHSTYSREVNLREALKGNIVPYHPYRARHND